MPCKNGGICIEPEICDCKGTNFIGDHCEDVKCGPEPTILNSKQAIRNETNCQISCNDGYAYSDRTNAVEIICEGGQWKSNRTDTSVCERKSLSVVIYLYSS